MTQRYSARQEKAAARILEDEGLTSSLEDSQAEPLLLWASEQAASFAGEEGLSDEALDAKIDALRRAVREASSFSARDRDPALLLERAKAALQRRLSTLSS